MGIVYRVWGGNLGDGACTIAESEKEAVEIVASAFGLHEIELKVAPDKSVSLPLGVILDELARIMRSRLAGVA